MTGEHSALNPADQPDDEPGGPSAAAGGTAAAPGRPLAGRPAEDPAGSERRGQPAQVVLRFAPLPEHVRTARLVAVAMARRSGVEEGLLDEVRLAVGEACSRAVGLHRGAAPRAPVEVRLIDSRERFGVEVLDLVSGGPVPKPDDPEDDKAQDQKAQGDKAQGGEAPAATEAAGASGTAEDGFGDDSGAQMGLAVLRGLVDDLEVRLTAQGGAIRMGWPVAGPRLTG
ncbi:MAG TPA: ATP-binding protein [Actinocrinis sp.]|jgi:anti-sigma regulatory factor (Ser/Thr protein kinase)